MKNALAEKLRREVKWHLKRAKDIEAHLEGGRMGTAQRFAAQRHRSEADKLQAEIAALEDGG